VAPDFYTVSVTAEAIMSLPLEHVRVEASCDIEVALVDSVRAPQNVACNEHASSRGCAVGLVLINPRGCARHTRHREAMTFDVLLNGQLYDTVVAACHTPLYLVEGPYVGQIATRQGCAWCSARAKPAHGPRQLYLYQRSCVHDDNNLINGIGAYTPIRSTPGARCLWRSRRPATQC
jgi:hypothetical protein